MRMQRKEGEEEEPEIKFPWGCWLGRQARGGTNERVGGGWRYLWSKSGKQGSHKRGWERLGAASQTSCLKATGGPGGRERKRGGGGRERFCTLSATDSFMDINTSTCECTWKSTCTCTHMIAEPRQRHTAATLSVPSQRPTATGSAGPQGSLEGRASACY